MANASVNVYLNGNTTTVITNESGHANLTVDLAPDEYDAYIIYDGNDHYYSSLLTVKVIVKKITPSLTASKKTFKLKSKTKKYSIKLKDDLGRGIEGAKVTVKVNGKKYKAITNSKGKAKFRFNLNKKGKYKAKIKFKGDAYFNAVSKKVKFTVK